tara:strand:- start:7 stop:405 length:399 start_codon:yes stop_codon:yes gene_type:complete
LFIKLVLTSLLNAFIIAPLEADPVMFPLFVKFSSVIGDPDVPAFATLLVFERVTPALITKSSPSAIVTVSLVFEEMICAFADETKEVNIKRFMAKIAVISLNNFFTPLFKRRGSKNQYFIFRSPERSREQSV